ETTLQYGLLQREQRPVPSPPPLSPSPVIDLVIPPLDALTLGASEQKHSNRPGRESGDVRPEGDPSSRSVAGGGGDRSDAAQELHQEPDAEKGNRRDLHDLPEEHQRDQRDDARVRIEDEV